MHAQHLHSPITGASGSKSRTVMTPSHPQDAMATALASERPIAYNANLARLVGDAKAALLLSQLLYWTRVGVDVEQLGGWIQKSRTQWTMETGLSRYEQETARKRLVKLGLIDVQTQGMPAKLAFKVELGALGEALANMLRATPVQWSLFDVRNNAQQVRALLGRSLAFYRVLADVSGSVTSGVFLARAIFAQRLMNDPTAWWPLQSDLWTDQTGLSSSQLNRTKQQLCHLNYLKQALVEWPRKRHVLQLDAQTLSAAIVQLRMERLGQGRASGLLGVFAKGLPLINPHPVENSKQAFPAGGKQLGKSSKKTQQAPRSPFWPTVSGGYSSPLWRTTLNSGVNPDQSPSDADIANLGGGFCDGENLQSSDLGQVGFVSPVGGFCDTSRGFLKDLHVRAQFLTTELKTTTPPTPSSPIRQTQSTWSAPVPGGGGGDDSSKDSTIWPDVQTHILASLQNVMSAHRVAQAMDAERRQLVIDELAAGLAKGTVRAPATYLGALLAKEAKGELDLSAAYDWQAKRALMAQRQAAVQQSIEAQATPVASREQTAWQQNQPITTQVQRGAGLAQSMSTPTSDAAAKAIWDSVLDALKGMHNAEQVDLWLSCLPVRFGRDGELVVCVKRFRLDFIKPTFGQGLARALELVATQKNTPVWQIVWVSQFSTANQ